MGKDISATSPTVRRRLTTLIESETTTQVTLSNGVQQEVKKVQRVITKNEFRERSSALDSLGEKRESSEFRGFFNLVTMGMVFFFITHETKSLLTEGTLIGLKSVWRQFSRYDLLPAWLLMCTFSFSPVILQKLILSRILPKFVISMARILLQCVFFGVCLLISLERDWPVVQTAFYLAELLVLAMKMHSYLMTNREYDKDYLLSVKNKKEEKSGKEETDTSDETAGPKEKKTQYPNNVTFYNYLDFLLVPTCVYELDYPRTEKIRPMYLAEKFFQFIGLWAVQHVLVDTYIVPILEQSPNMSQIEAICHLIMPFLGCYLLIFYMVFDVGCNGFAEITKFADREFYSDWWNSNTWDEFARKWNKPVHEFLLRHVYLETINNYKISKNNATVLTFFFSSIVHEFFMGFALKMFRPWLFFFQMAQIPLIYISRLPLFRRSRLGIGNHFFWFGLTLGIPLISILYAREYFLLYGTEIKV